MNICIKETCFLKLVIPAKATPSNLPVMHKSNDVKQRKTCEAIK